MRLHRWANALACDKKMKVTFIFNSGKGDASIEVTATYSHSSLTKPCLDMILVGSTQKVRIDCSKHTATQSTDYQ